MRGMERINPLNSTNPSLFVALAELLEEGVTMTSGYQADKRIRGRPSAYPFHHPLVILRHPALAELFEDVIASEGLTD